MARGRLRRFVDLFRRTPLHPQWLLSTGVNMRSDLVRLTAGTVLDIGCADRWIEQQLAPGCHYIGLDYPNTGVAWYGARPDVLADAADLPIADASVDAVVILEVVEHLERPRQALLEIARVLRPQGRLLLSIPFLYPVHDAPQDFQRYTEHGLRRELEDAGFSVDHLGPSLGSAESAGVLFNLALGGMASEALRRRSVAILLVPALALAIPVINLLAWALSALLPHWAAFTTGYTVSARKS